MVTWAEEEKKGLWGSQISEDLVNEAVREEKRGSNSIMSNDRLWCSLINAECLSKKHQFNDVSGTDLGWGCNNIQHILWPPALLHRRSWNP